MRRSWWQYFGLRLQHSPVPVTLFQATLSLFHRGFGSNSLLLFRGLVEIFWL
jgi:hypothetical protein